MLRRRGREEPIPSPFSPPPPKRSWRSSMRRGLAVFLAAEAVGFVGIFGMYVMVNRNQEIRRKLYESSSGRLLLEQYYLLGETMSAKNKAIREADMRAFGVEAAPKGSE
jgi:heme/copper-type cytochrome/quinol oxidase subunit 3